MNTSVGQTKEQDSKSDGAMETHGSAPRERGAVLALYLSVFVTGFAVLALETIAFRMLSPFFGSTIFSFSSVITVVLAGLSLGYLVGGWYADRGAERVSFYRLICIGGVVSLVFYASVPLILSAVSTITYSMVWGSLIGSTIAFLIPAFVLGMVSPYAIKLAIMDRGITAAGQTAGALFAFSTAGSIAGSIAAGFWLIPNYAISWTVICLSLILIFWGGVGWMVYRSERRTRISIILAWILVSGVGYGIQVDGVTVPLPYAGTIVHQEEGVYQTVSVLDTKYRNEPARILVLDRGLSSGISLVTGRLIFDYALYQDLHLLYAPKPERALFLGGGSASQAHALYDATEDTHIVVVDIEPILPRISYTYFTVPESERLEYVIDDARVYLRRTDQQYEYIFSDVFASVFSVPSHVMTEEFFRLAHERLAPEGVFMINIIGSLDPRPPSALFSVYNTMARVFPMVELFAVNDPDSYMLQNMIIVASNGDSVIDRIESIESEAMRRAFWRMARNRVDMGSYDLARYRPYRDDFASVESDLGVLLLRFERDELLRAR